MQTMLDVADNTGAKRAQCIKVLGGTHRRYATLGDVVVATIKKSLPGSDVKPGTIVKGVIVRVRKNTRREDGSYVRFDRNALVIIDNDQEPQGHAHLRRGRPRAAREELHEDHLAGPGGGVMHVKKGDVVEVIAGNDKGKTGEVVQALPRENRVVVEGVNLRWRHERPSEQHPKGQRVQVERSIHASNVRLSAAADTGKKSKRKS